MPRPTRPRIDRRGVVAAALDLIERDGLASFTMPRLADELGVRTPSLYHHFENRDELLRRVSYLVTSQVVMPDPRKCAQWEDLFVALALNFRRTVLAYPQASGLLLQHMPREVLASRYEEFAEYLTANGVPVELHVTLLDGMEKYSIGAALTDAADGRDRVTAQPFSDTEASLAPHLSRAVEASRLDAEERLELIVRSFLAGLLALTNAADTRKEEPNVQGHVRTR